ncbi:unnamed protein product, partial [Polarella glacialis]
VADAVAGLPFRTGAFNVVLEKGFFDALLSTRQGEAKLPSALREAWRVLAAGGVLISASQPGQLAQGSSPRVELFLQAGLQPPPESVVEVEGLPSRGLRCYVVRKPLDAPE